MKVKAVLSASLMIVVLLFAAGCEAPAYDQDGGGSGGYEKDQACGPCAGSGRCNTCNGTGRFLGFGDTGCSTCSGTGVCINCGGRGR